MSHNKPVITNLRWNTRRNVRGHIASLILPTLDTLTDGGPYITRCLCGVRLCPVQQLFMTSNYATADCQLVNLNITAALLTILLIFPVKPNFIIFFDWNDGTRKRRIFSHLSFFIGKSIKWGETPHPLIYYDLNDSFLKCFGMC